MKITDVRSVAVSIPLAIPTAFSTRLVTAREFAVVWIDTDEGITGVGYAYGGRLIHSAIETNLKGLLIGEDPFAVERLWEKMFRETLLLGRQGVIMRGISALDIALWDIIGKAAGQPLYKLLGGYRDEVPAYASGGYYREGKGLRELAAEMERYVERGFRAVKMKVGGSPKDDIERVRAVRDAIGPDVQLAVDANNAFADAASAIRWGRAVEKYDIWWFEEPVMPDNLGAGAEIAAALDMPVATGELEGNRYAFRNILERKAADILQPDVGVVGGITEWLKVAHMAGAWDIPIAPHWFWDVHAHLVAATANSITVEYFYLDEDVFNTDRIMKEPMAPVNGKLRLPQKPGLGIELDEAAVERYRIG
jgi:D-arabinonate dehydratase